MDDKARQKALFRSKLNAQKKEKRIDSPLVRYNEHDQPVCRVCDIVMKSESYWDAHQASRKHHEAINNLKAAAAASRENNAKSEPKSELPKHKPEHVVELHMPGPEPRESTRPQSASMLPPDFFDKNSSKKLNSKKDSAPTVEPGLHKETRDSVQGQVMVPSNLGREKYGLPTGGILETQANQPSKKLIEKSEQIADSEGKQVQGVIPEGFFDNKEADLRARGIKPIKPDVKDEYKEFEKVIQEDLKEVDDRLEEEEIDTAEMIEEAESVAQRTYREKVQMLRKRKMELKVAMATKQRKASEVAMKGRPSHDESSSDDDSDDSFAVDWRAQHL